MLQPDADARLAALLLAIDPTGLGGAIVHGPSRGACELWLEAYVTLAPGAPVKRVPAHISEERLLGGLDFAATLARGSAVCEAGVLAQAHEGCLVLTASTTRVATWAHVARALDDRRVVVERDGLSVRHDAAFAAVAITTEGDDLPAPVFADRVALVVDLRDTSRSLWGKPLPLETVLRARRGLPDVSCSDAMLTALATGASRLGVGSLRIALRALAAARAHAALNERTAVTEDDIVSAARLVLAPRAVHPASPEEQDAPTSPVPENDTNHDAPAEPATPPRTPPPGASMTDGQALDSPEPGEAGVLADTVVRAAASALPAGLLAALAARASSRTGAAGRAGAEQQGHRGRQIGIARGDPRGGARLDLVATLRAAIPLQRVRRAARASGAARLVELRRDDFRIRRCATPATTTTLFVVDVSGSAALHRLAEAKGAVELMLAEGYARRDRVAVIAFRGTVAEVVLPPTHALARARRAVAGMPAGGGTPLATALDLATQLVASLRRDAAQIVTVILTDGRANVARDGRGGRARAEADALDAARRLAASGHDAVWIDTASRTDPLSRRLADALGARYVVLPAPNAQGVHAVARMAARTAAAP